MGDHTGNLVQTKFAGTRSAPPEVKLKGKWSGTAGGVAADHASYLRTLQPSRGGTREVASRALIDEVALLMNAANARKES